MCIYFLYINNGATDDDDLQVVIALNRDELYDRPTQPANFWNIDCIGGVDIQPGREGGTWFGVNSKLRRIGALLNIPEVHESPNKIPRGQLVTDFLRGSETGAEYAQRISASRQDYSGFNLVLVDYSNGEWNVNYCSSLDEHSPRQLLTGILAFGNSIVDHPWRKVVRGHDMFESIVRQYTKCEQLDALRHELLGMLTDRTRHLPDPQLESQYPPGYNEALLAARSSIYVDFMPHYRYGTRTHTVLVIDFGGRCDYFERTMKSATADVFGNTETEWETSQFSFQLDR